MFWIAHADGVELADVLDEEGVDDALDEDDADDVVVAKVEEEAAEVRVSDAEVVDLDAVEVDDVSAAVVFVAVASVAVSVAAAVSVTLVAAVSFGGISLGCVGTLGGVTGALAGTGSPFEKGLNFPMTLPKPFSASSAPSSTIDAGIFMGALPRMSCNFRIERLKRGIFAGVAGGVLVPEVDGAVAGALQSSVFKSGLAWAKNANHAKLCALVIFCASVSTSRQLGR